MPCTSQVLPHWSVVHSYRGGNRGSESPSEVWSENKLRLLEPPAFSHSGLRYTYILKPQA